MQLWIGFLLLSFLFGARSARPGHRERPLLIFAGCLLVAFLFTFQRFT